MAEREWNIPVKLQPDPRDYAFDVERALTSVVGLRALVPQDAYTAGVLGTERTGSGVVIREDGLVLTIGYLITEAETVWLTLADGRAVPGHALGYDQDTGFGLVQPLGRLNVPPLPLGETADITLGQPAIFASAGGRHRAIATRVIGRQEFAGYWEYLLESALFTAPAHPFWGGAGLIGQDGRLLGIGSLILQQGDAKGNRVDMNMVVPIDLLRPILDDLLAYGRVNQPPRPWLGIYATENGEGLMVEGVADHGPAEQAGLQPGDRILGIEDEEVSDLADLWRKLWSRGPAGTEIVLQVQRAADQRSVAVASADRNGFLKAPRLH